MFLRNSFIIAASVAVAACGQRPSQSETVPTESFAAFQAFEAAHGVSNEAEASCNDACQSLRQEFRYIVAVGKEIYCYWDLKKSETGIDYDALAAEIEATIVSGTGIPEYYTAMQRWAAAFHDGHVNILATGSLNPLQAFAAPVELSVIAPATERERVIITKSSDPKFLVGDELLAVNGVDTKTAIDRLEAIRSGSTARMRRGRAANLVNAVGAAAGSADLKLKVKRGNQTFEHLTFRTSAIDPTPAPTPNPGNVDAINSVKVMTLAGGVGYLRMDTFSAEGLEGVLDEAIDRLVASRALILDVRKNGGGTQAGDRIISRLIDSPKTRYEVASRKSNFLFFSRPDVFSEPDSDSMEGYAAWHPLVVQPHADARLRGKPVVVLTSSRCFSACDTFTVGLKTNNLATVMGEATGGGTGSPLVFELPNSGFSFRYSVVRGRTFRGDWIEGQGTQPDILVEADDATLKGSADNQLDAAYAHLRQRLGDRREPESVADEVLTAHGSVFSGTLGVPQALEEAFELRRDAAVDEWHHPAP